eukprot:3017688-Alexandrium_andersonii.AAC.1
MERAGTSVRNGMPEHGLVLPTLVGLGKSGDNESGRGSNSESGTSLRIRFITHLGSCGTPSAGTSGAHYNYQCLKKTVQARTLMGPCLPNSICLRPGGPTNVWQLTYGTL